jgi:glutamate dehydrogenase (NADP+)
MATFFYLYSLFLKNGIPSTLVWNFFVMGGLDTGANMPCTVEAIEVFRKSKIVFGPGKAANAGGVAIQGLEMLQSTNHVQWTPEDVDIKLQEIMKDIYQKSLKAAIDFGIVEGSPEALVHGANIASFLQVAQAMLEQGCV